MASVKIDLCFEDDTVEEKMAWRLQDCPGVQWEQVSKLDSRSMADIRLTGPYDTLREAILDLCAGDWMDAKKYISRIENEQKSFHNHLRGILNLIQSTDGDSLTIIYERTFGSRVQRFRYHHHVLEDGQYVVSIMKIARLNTPELWNSSTVQFHLMGATESPHPKVLERLLCRIVNSN